MSSSPFNRDALRRNLQATLTDSLMDVGFDTPAPHNNGSSVALAQVQRPSPSFTGQSSFFDVPNLPSVQQAFFAQGLNFPQQNPPACGQMRSAPTALGGLSASDLILSAAAAEERNFLDHARIALLKQQITQHRERLLLRESYNALLRDKIGNVNQGGFEKPSMYTLGLMAQQASLPSQGYQAPSLLTNALQASAIDPEEKKQKSAKALQALGSSLRQSTDPYIDVSCVADPDPDDSQVRRTRGGVTEPFPEKLHRMLQETEKEGKTDIVSFFSHGRAFAVHDIDRFVSDIMPRFFKQTKWNSFARQLNLYGFVRITSGPDSGGYYHELFLRGRPNLCFHMRRVGVPQGKDRRKFKSQTKTIEPDFYSMAKIEVTNPENGSA